VRLENCAKKVIPTLPSPLHIDVTLETELLQSATSNCNCCVGRRLRFDILRTHIAQSEK
jgi:hypothetical protein